MTGFGKVRHSRLTLETGISDPRAASLRLTSLGVYASYAAHPLPRLHATYEELTEAYEALRRMVERGYLCFLDHAA